MKTVLGMTTLPARLEAALDAVRSLRRQASEVHLYVSEELAHVKIPGNVFVHVVEGSGDQRKFTHAFDGLEADCYGTVDDDILYPPDYVKRIVDAVERHNCPVSVHGRIQYNGSKSYYNGPMMAFPCLRMVPKDSPVTILGTGVMCWKPEHVRLTPADFPVDNMADIWFSKLCNEQGVRRVVMAHEAGWIRENPKIDPSTTIAHVMRGRDRYQTEVFNSVEWACI